MGAEHPYYKSAQFAHVEEDEEDEEDSPVKSPAYDREERPIWQKILIRSIPIIVIVCLVLYQLMIGFPFLTFDRHAEDDESSETLSSFGSLKYVSMIWLKMSNPPEATCPAGTL